jgi:endonuclease YncB( thermonuclease family)
MQDAFSARTSGALLLEALLESADGAAACLQAAVAASFERAAAAKARRHSAAHRLRHPHGAMERSLRLGRPLPAKRIEQPGSCVQWANGDTVYIRKAQLCTP